MSIWCRGLRPEWNVNNEVKFLELRWNVNNEAKIFRIEMERKQRS